MPTNLFWDSCVFYAFLKNENAAYDIGSIEQYLRELRDGKHKIYTSSLVFAEVVPSAIVQPGIGSFQDFVDDFQGAIIVIDPSPNVMHHAARLKDLPYRRNQSPGRRLGTPDAIMLASCLELQTTLGVNIDHFHTYDDGKKRHPVDGKCVPLLSYEHWCEGFTVDQMNVAQPVIALSRRVPIHPQPDLLNQAAAAAQPVQPTGGQ